MRTKVLTADGNRALGRLGGGKSSSGGRAKAETGILKAQEGGEKAVLLGKVLRQRENCHSVQSGKWP